LGFFSPVEVLALVSPSFPVACCPMGSLFVALMMASLVSADVGGGASEIGPVLSPTTSMLESRNMIAEKADAY
jgi:hypothetical protein